MFISILYIDFIAVLFVVFTLTLIYLLYLLKEILLMRSNDNIYIQHKTKNDNNSSTTTKRYSDNVFLLLSKL